MEAWVTCPFRWLACATLLLVSMATPTRAQAPDGNTLPEAPEAAEAGEVEPGIDAHLSRSPASTPARTAKTQVVSNSEVTLRECPYDRTDARICRVHWGQLIISSVIFNAFQNAGNLYTGYWYRYETTHGEWWNRYVNSVEGWRWDVWSDNNPFLDDYVGHPMMGSITNYLWIQNDPKSMTLEQSNTWPYWRRMLRAGAFSTFYSFEWKLGPFGEAGIGHNGDHYFSDEKNTVYTNETGWVELVTTPVGGLLWTIAEDALDKHVVRRLEAKSRNPLALTMYQFLSPSRATANIFRFRPPWYRDSRTVKAKSFFSEPAGPEEEDLSSETATTAAAERNAASSPGNYRTTVDIAPARPVTYLPRALGAAYYLLRYLQCVSKRGQSLYRVLVQV